MAVPAHTRLTFSGVFGTAASPIEEWSFNINMSPLTTTTMNDFVTLSGLARVAWQNRLVGLFGPSTILTKTRAASVDGTGHVTKNPDGSYKQADDLTNSSGAGTQTVYPPLQTAVVVSLNTARAGATGKGRFFLPWTGFTSLAADFRIAQSSQNSIATAAKGFLDDLKVAAGQPVVVASSKGYLTPVTSIRVGRVPDTQRSRRGELQESYVTANLA